MYTAFAHVYDALMATVDYGAWAGHYRQLMRLAGVPDKGKCVECACGTGSLTLPLRRVGYQITGIDLSEDMIAAAAVVGGFSRLLAEKVLLLEGMTMETAAEE